MRVPFLTVTWKVDPNEELPLLMNWRDTRHADEGQLTEESVGYSFFWIGRNSDGKRESIVGCAIEPHSESCWFIKMY